MSGAPARPQLGPGTIIGGKYRLVRVVGEGGMGSVWVAHNEALDVPVALKWIRASSSERSQSSLPDRLLQEARAAARLDHPAIVRIFDFGVADGDEPYIVMELLTGEDLGTIIERHSQIGATKVVQSLLPIAGALSVAHRAGIVHRDLKPQNIFMVPLGDDRMQPKLIDFGVAKLTDGKKSNVQTSAGALVGSPAYISPEQAQGGDIDHRADIWSFCVVLYEAITGKLPFEAPSPLSTVMKVLEANPPTFTELGVDEPELWAIVRQGLRKAPEDRWQSMAELRQALAEWLIARNIYEEVSGAPLESAKSARNSQPNFWSTAPSPRAKRGPNDTPTPSPLPAIRESGETAKIALDTTYKSPKTDPPDGSPASGGRRARVLLADDDGVFRRFVEVALKTNLPQVQLECVADGQAAIDAIDRDPPDIALLDLEMPKCGGMEVTASIRSGRHRQKIKVIILTAVGGPTDWKVLFSLGADEFMVKPLRVDQLVGTIDRLLKEVSTG